MWTMQTFIAGYRDPEDTEVAIVYSIREAKHRLQEEHTLAERYGAAYDPSTALLWKGNLRSVADVLPDRQLEIGPRGGVQVTTL